MAERNSYLMVDDKSFAEIEQVNFVRVVHPQVVNVAGNGQLGIAIEQLHDFIV